jgi:hypothetical protein
MKLQRVGLIAAVVLAGTVLGAPWSHGATPAAKGLPLYQFVNTGTGVLPWNATSLESKIESTTMLGGPHTASSATEGALAYRTSKNHLALYTQSVTGTSQWSDLTAPNNNLPVPGADPVPFFDPAGNVDLLYVNTLGELILTTANIPFSPIWIHATKVPWRPYVAVDLSALTGASAANGLASIQVRGESAMVTFRTASNDVEEIPLAWTPNLPAPSTIGPAVNVTSATSTGTAASDPIALPGVSNALVTTTTSGDLELYSTTTAGAWVAQDLTAATAGPNVSGTLNAAATASTLYISALGTDGAVELFSTPFATFAPNLVGARTAATTTTTTTTTIPLAWSVLNVTAATPSAPPLTGSIYLSASATQVAIAGEAADWGDLFVLTNTLATSTWTATDVSVTGGSASRTVGSTVSGLQVGTSLDLIAGGINSPPPQGVGVYAIPSAKWRQAVSDGWPILSETGGLGTQSAPWVGFTSATSVADSPDFLLGQSIYNSHKRVTWLSFWTVSGPLAAQPQTTTNYYNHGYAAGAWVATQIDQYKSLGLGLKPDWVIFDPEGYPDNHSHLDAPAGASKATIATYATYWTAMLQGWVKGMASVNPSLNAAVYASQSEYRNYSLSVQPLPVFVALAFGSGGPVPVAGASGSNIRGFIAFSAVCAPPATLASEISTLANPPWAGQFNTLQFNANVYCPPAKP